MSSRIAESLYWIGRYVERAEDTARLLDVHYHLLLEDRRADEATVCRALLNAMGADDEAVGAEPNAARVTALLAQDLTFSGSITCSVGKAWENARGAREALSSELWETLDTTYREVGSRARAGTGPARHEFFGWVRDRAAACNGIVDAMDDLPSLLERLQHECADVHASYNEARISPLDTPNQFTLEHRVEVHPAANLFRYRDYWGSRVHAFDLHQPHTELKVVGSSVVETAERTPNLDDTVAWDAVDAPGLTDRFFEYLGDTRMTKSDDDIRQVARELRSASGPAAALSTLGEWLRAHVEYQTGTTSVSTTAVEVLRAGRGVCQDHAHLGIAVLRAAGIPARYASGYPYPDDIGGVLGEMHQGESHAWLEAWVGDWHPVDPTSGSAVAERHVLVARGRDYADVAPLKRIYHGGPSRALNVSVELTRVA